MLPTEKDVFGSPQDHASFCDCCDEALRELFRIGEAGCKSFTKIDQLCAVIILLIRCFSILRMMPSLLKSECLDVFESVRRSFVESWLLAYELRFKTKKAKAEDWLTGKSDSWKADRNFLDKHARSQRKDVLDLKKYYSDLSNLAHPTRNAAENSFLLTATRFGLRPDSQDIERAHTGFDREKYEDLYRTLWLMLAEDEKFIILPAEDEKPPIALSFVSKYQSEFMKIEPDGRKGGN
jgi:hypothetical protein